MTVSLLLWRLVHSPFGRVLQAIRQNETRARFVGYEVWRLQGGCLRRLGRIVGPCRRPLRHGAESAYPDVMSLHQSGLVVMMMLVGGGLVSFWGPVIGVVVYFVARDVLGALTESWLLWYGLMFIAS